MAKSKRPPLDWLQLSLAQMLGQETGSRSTVTARATASYFDLDWQPLRWTALGHLLRDYGGLPLNHLFLLHVSKIPICMHKTD